MIKEFTIKYLKKDLRTLFEVMKVYIDRVFYQHKVQPVNNITNSSLAINIFLTKFIIAEI